MSLAEPPLAPPFPLTSHRFQPIPSSRGLPIETLSSSVIVDRFGRSSVSPFLLGTDREVIHLEYGVTGYVRRGRWAVMGTDPASPIGTELDTLMALLDHLKSARLRPVFAAVSAPELYTQCGLHATPVAEDPIVRLGDFSLSGKRRSSIRHSVTSARRAGLRVRAWDDELVRSAEAMSASWLSTKRGGELGFTLGRFDADTIGQLDCRVVVDGDGRVLALATWHRYDDGRGRVLDLMRRAADAPNPAMDLLIAESLLDFAALGVKRASLGSVPLSHGSLAERIYPTRSLRRYKDKFAPEWECRFLVAPSRWRAIGAELAVARAYCPTGLLRGIRRNG